MATAEAIELAVSAVSTRLGGPAAGDLSAIRCAIVFTLALSAQQRQVLRTQVEAADMALDRGLDDVLFREIRSSIQQAKIAGVSGAIGKFAAGRDKGIADFNAKFDAAAAVMRLIPFQRVAENCPAVANLLKVITRGAGAEGVKLDTGSLEDLRLARNGLEYELHKFTDLDTGLNQAKTYIKAQKDKLMQWAAILDVLDTIEGT